MNDFQKSSLFSTYVVASGLQYGMGEHMFHLFFKVVDRHLKNITFVNTFY